MHRTITRVIAVIAAALALAVGAGTSPSSAVTTVQRSYVWDGFAMVHGIPGTAPVVCSSTFGLSPDIGGGCFQAPSEPGSVVDITIDDDSGAPVVGRYSLLAGTDTFVAGYFCGSISDLAVPPATTLINVYVLTQVAGGPCAVDSVATTGTIELRVH